MESLTSTTTKHNNHHHHNKEQVTKRNDEKPKIVEPCIIVDSPSTINNSTTTMSREEFISINESMLDEDMIAVPTAEGILHDILYGVFCDFILQDKPIIIFTKSFFSSLFVGFH